MAKHSPRKAPSPWRALLAALGLVVLLALGLGVALRPARQMHSIALGGGFRLAAADGRQVGPQDFPGHLLLVYFGYTSCPDICPQTMARMAAALDLLGADAARVQPLFITLDPLHDTPAQAGRFAAAFSPRLIGLGGSPAQIAAVLRFYRVYAAPSAGGAGFDHTALLYLITPDGRLKATLRPAGSPAALAHELSGALS